MPVSKTSLIVNADDYGYTPGVSKGIRLAARAGVVSSTTLMMNTPYVDHDLDIALDEIPQLPLGVHLVLTSGTPLSPRDEIPSLVASDGNFHTLTSLQAGIDRIVAREVRSEWTRQVEKLGERVGSIDHLDSHHHASYLDPLLAEVMLSIAQQYKLPVRKPPDPPASHRDVPRLFQRADVWSPDLLIEDLRRGSTIAKLTRIIDALPPGSTAKIMAHPAVLDEPLLDLNTYAKPREAELAVLTSPRLRAAILAQNVELTSFRSARGF